MEMTRREALKCAVAAAMAGAGASGSGAAEGSAAGRSALGIVEYAIGIHRRIWRQEKKGDLADPLVFLEEAKRLGAGGIQMALGQRDAESLSRVRRFAEENALHVEAIIEPPREAGDVEQFERDVQSAMAGGAGVARTVIMPGRRYEQFASMEAFRAAEKAGERALELAEPVLKRRRFRLAVENHKDQRLGERVGLLKRLSSEFIGACVDVGNSFALLEDPMEVVQGLAPWAMSVHLKDQSAREYADGFEYADVAMGRGFLDLPAMVGMLRKARPEVRFNLEVITRDALKVPVFTEGYWRTFGEVRGWELARTMRVVRKHAARGAFAMISGASSAEQLVAERANIVESVRYARERLGL